MRRKGCVSRKSTNVRILGFEFVTKRSFTMFAIIFVIEESMFRVGRSFGSIFGD